MEKQKGFVSLATAAIVSAAFVVGLVSEHYFEKPDNVVNKIAKCVIKHVKPEQK